MKIVDARVRVFSYTMHEKRDVQGHQHYSEPWRANMALLTLTAEDGVEGHCFGAVETVRPYLMDRHIRPLVVGRDSDQREAIWHDLIDSQRSSGGHFHDKAVGVVEQALWDMAGRRANMPVYKMVGAYRERIRPYASTMCGDEHEGGLATPEDYGRFAETLVKRGYKGIKLHTWNSPLPGKPDPKWDARACAAVREAVGPDIGLMLDPYHRYSRQDALWLAREAEKLGFLWIEEPMYEGSISAYVWLCNNLDMAVCGPETIEGRHQLRADWMKAGACDIARCGVLDLGGITPSLKVIDTAESFGMDTEIHHAGPGSLVLCAARKGVAWYERGLLHPFIDYDAVPEYLNSRFDAMGPDGYIDMPQLPGLGYDINFDYIENNRVK